MAQPLLPKSESGWDRAPGAAAKREFFCTGNASEGIAPKIVALETFAADSTAVLPGALSGRGPCSECPLLAHFRSALRPRRFPKIIEKRTPAQPGPLTDLWVHGLVPGGGTVYSCLQSCGWYPGRRCAKQRV